MELQYDRDADALYIQVTDALVARTDQIEPGTLVDVDSHGRIRGIEVLRPARLWPVDEIADRYDLSPEARKELNELAWGDNEGFRWTQPPMVAAG